MTPKNDDAKNIHIDPRQLWLPIGAVATVVIALLSGTWAVASGKGALDRNTAAVEKLESKVTELLGNHVAIRLWIAAFAAKNPTLVVPDLNDK